MKQLKVNLPQDLRAKLDAACGAAKRTLANEVRRRLIASFAEVTSDEFTLDKFSNELRRLHCIDGDQVPELSLERAERFVRNPVDFFVRADDQTQQAIWRAMERDRRRWQEASGQ
jgi:hypothetical protein